RNSSARWSWTRFASSRDTGFGIARRIESTGIARAGLLVRPRPRRTIEPLVCLADPGMSHGEVMNPSTRRLLAWSVHLFTASGAVLAVFALWELGRGGVARAAVHALAALAGRARGG